MHRPGWVVYLREYGGCYAPVYPAYIKDSDFGTARRRPALTGLVMI